MWLLPFVGKFRDKIRLKSNCKKSTIEIFYKYFEKANFAETQSYPTPLSLSFSETASAQAQCSNYEDQNLWWSLTISGVLVVMKKRYTP